MKLRYRILGPTQALRSDGSEARLGGARLRALLAALAAGAGRAVPQATLIAQVWGEGDAPPTDEAGAVQALVGRLRRTLGRSAVESVPGGYRLAARADEIDLFRFERLAAEGATALAAGDPERAGGLLDEALVLWHGPALADLPSRDGDPLVVRAERHRADARRNRLAVEAELGRAESALGELAALAFAAPLDEPLQALHIRALRAAGRSAEALATYESVRGALSERLGTTPGPELVALHAELLNPERHAASALKGSGQGSSGRGGSDHGGSFGVGSDPNSTGHLRSGPLKSDHTGSSDVVPPNTASHGATPPYTDTSNGPSGGPGSGRTASDYTGSGHTSSDHMASGHVASDHTGSGHTASGQTGSDHMCSGHAASDHTASDHTSSADTAPDHSTSGHTLSSQVAQGCTSPDCVAPSHTPLPHPGPSRAASAHALPPHSAHLTPHHAAAAGPGSDGHESRVGREASAVRVAGNLRARLTSFVGREVDVQAVHEDLMRARLVTLTGPGGAGKTRLAIEAADAVAGRWDDGVWLVELAPVRDAASLTEAVLTALGARETRLVGPADTTPRDPFAQLMAHCGRLRMLIVLDNCEQVVDAAAELAEELLTSCPGVAVLATSREPLGVPGERVRALGPLPHESALRLFGQRGAAARTGFSADDDPDAVAEICRRLDGLPLALELAAARLRLFTPRQIADRLDDRFRLLNTGSRTSRTLQPRQQTLRAVVDWSWDLLDSEEQALLRRLAVFAGGFALPEAEAVCEDREAAALDEPGPGAAVPGRSVSSESTSRPGAALSGRSVPGVHAFRPGTVAPGRSVPGENPSCRGTAAPGRSAIGESAPHRSARLRVSTPVIDLLGSLVDKSLVTAAPVAGGGMRYRLLETVAEYAAQRLDEAGERAEVELRHLVAYRELVRTREPLLRGPRQHEVIQCFEAEHGNVRAALGKAVERKREQDALCLVLAMAWFWQLRGHQADARGWAGEVAALGPDPFAEPVRPAVPLADRCTDSPPPWSKERRWEARRGVHLMVFAASGGSDTELTSPGAVTYLRRIVDAYGAGLPQNSRQPGSVWYFARLLTGEFTGFDRVVDEMVADARRHGDPWDLAFTLLLRAKLAGGRDAAEALALFERIGDPWGIAESLSARGESYAREDRYEEAAADFERALDEVARLGAHRQVPEFKGRLAAVRLETARTPGERAAAERLLVEAVEESRHFAGEDIGTVRMLLAQHYGRIGRLDDAREQLRSIEAEFGPQTPELFRGLVAGLDGWLDCLDGRYEGAQRRIREAVRHLESQAYLVAPQVILSQFLSSAWAKAHAGDALDGARLLGAYDRSSTGHGSFGFRPPAVEPETRRRAEAALRAALDAGSYERAYAEGAHLDVREAAALV